MVSRVLAGAFSLIIPFLVMPMQTASGPGFNGSSYSNDELAFHYVPPRGMLDETQIGNAQIRAHAAEQHADKVLDLLLALTNGQVDTSAWQSLTIQTYPRKAVRDTDDLVAEEQMSAWVVGLPKAPASPIHSTLAGQEFVISVFGTKDGHVAKGAVVWTTIRRGKLLSFAFVANSPDRLKALAESMKTIQFF